MNLRAGLILFLALGSVARPAIAAVPGGKLPDSFDLSAIDAFLSAQVREASRVGLSVAIVKDGQVVLARGYGKRSLENGRPVEADTLFAIGSVSDVGLPMFWRTQARFSTNLFTTDDYLAWSLGFSTLGSRRVTQVE